MFREGNATKCILTFQIGLLHGFWLRAMYKLVHLHHAVLDQLYILLERLPLNN